MVKEKWYYWTESKDGKKNFKKLKFSKLPKAKEIKEKNE